MKIGTIDISKIYRGTTEIGKIYKGTDVILSPPVIPRNITGGSVTTSGSYTIHTFTTNDNLVVTSLGTTSEFEVLLVGGGAGGRGSFNNEGSYPAGTPGTGGGVLSGTITNLSNGTFPIVIGAAGTAGPWGGNSLTGAYGGNGGNTTFNGFIAYGGYTNGRTTTSQDSQSPLTGYGMGGNQTSLISGSSVVYGQNGSGTSNGTGVAYGGGGAVGGFGNAGKAGGVGRFIIRYLT